MILFLVYPFTSFVVLRTVQPIKILLGIYCLITMNLKEFSKKTTKSQATYRQLTSTRQC